MTTRGFDQAINLGETLSYLEALTLNLAVEKNMPTEGLDYRGIAERALLCFDQSDLPRFSDRDREAVAAATRAVSYLLDIPMAGLVISCIRTVCGFDTTSETLPIYQHALDWMDDHAARLQDDGITRWPRARDYIKSLRGEVITPTAAPQLSRCSFVPGSPGYLAEGCQTVALSKGEICTTHWVGGKRHRDPALGPAILVQNISGEIIAEEFWREGEFLSARFPNDAPTP